MTTFRKIVLISSAVILVLAGRLSAQTVVTTNAGDESNGSLGWAVTTLNNAGAGAISIGNVGTITLTQPLPAFTQDVTLQGGSSNVIGSPFSFQGFTLDSAAALTLTNNTGLDTAMTATSGNLSNNSSFSFTGGAGATGTGLGGGNAGSASVTTTSLALSGAQGTIEGGLGGADSYQDGNGGSATLSTGSLTLDTAAQLQVVGGSVGLGNGALGNGGNAVLTANSVSLTGSGTQLALFGGDGGSPQAVNTGPGPVNGGDGGSVSFAASSVTMDSQALFTVTGGQAGSVSATSSGRGGTGGSVTVLLGSLDFTNSGALSIVAGDGGTGAKGWIGGNAFVTVGAANQGTGSTLSIVSGIGGGNSSGGSVNFFAASQTLASGATFIAQGNAGGSGASAGGNGGSVQVGVQALTLTSGSLWEVSGGAGGTGTSTNGAGGSAFVNIHDLEGSGTVSMGGPGQDTLQLTNGNFSGVIAGSEGLNLTGFGTVTLTGNNTYSGGTTLSIGTAVVNNENNLGTGNLTLDTGTLVLGNFNTTKSISLSSNGGTIVTTPTDIALFSGVISGPGGLLLTGGGSVILNAVDSYTGQTTLADGSLVLDGGSQVGGAVVVAGAASTLTGTGSISGAVTNNGTVQAGSGSATGTLAMGAYTQGAGGTLDALVSPTGANSLAVAGAASLAGAVTVDQTAGTYTGLRYRYVLLSAGSLAGTFTTTDFTVLPSWNPLVTYGSNAVTFILFHNVDFTPWAVGANQTAVAQALNAAVPTGSDSLVNKLNEINQLPSGQGLALGQLTGDLYTALPGILLDNAQFEDSLLFDRLDGGTGTGMGSAQAGLVRNILSAEVSGPGGQAAGLANPGAGGLWIENTDSAGSVNSDGNVEGFNQSNYGFLAGYDTELSKGLTGGIMGGWVHTDATGTYTGAKAGVDSAQFGVYGSKKFGAVELGLVAGYGLDHLTANRTVSIGSDVTALAGTADGSQIQAALQGSYDLGVPGFTLKPLAGMAYAHLSENAFTETGSDSLALAIPAQSTDSLRPYLGVEGSKYLVVDQDLGLLPRLNLSVSQELMASATSFQTSLSGATGNPFTVTGITPSATTIGVEAGARLIFGKQLNLFANYQGHFSATENLNTFNGGLDISF